jgi:hypothetical protein
MLRNNLKRRIDMAYRGIGDDKPDIEKCKSELQAVLDKWGCILMDKEEMTSGVLIYDLDTKETINAKVRRV